VTVSAKANLHDITALAMREAEKRIPARP
jgi:hypothetical protein